MADQFVQVAADSVGKKIDASELSVGANTVERQRINISDPTTAAAHASVLNAAPAGTEYGLSVRSVGTVNVTEVRPASSAVTSVAASTSSVTLAASNAARRMLIVFNDSTATLYLKFGATASTTSFTVQVAAQGYWEMPFPAYTGIVDAVWSLATGSARVTEY